MKGVDAYTYNARVCLKKEKVFLFAERGARKLGEIIFYQTPVPIAFKMLHTYF